MTHAAALEALIYCACVPELDCNSQKAVSRRFIYSCRDTLDVLKQSLVTLKLTLPPPPPLPFSRFVTLVSRASICV